MASAGGDLDEDDRNDSGVGAWDAYEKWDFPTRVVELPDDGQPGTWPVRSQFDVKRPLRGCGAQKARSVTLPRVADKPSKWIASVSLKITGPNYFSG
jgi:hypothetical protein